MMPVQNHLMCQLFFLTRAMVQASKPVSKRNLGRWLTKKLKSDRAIAVIFLISLQELAMLIDVVPLVVES